MRHILRFISLMNCGGLLFLGFTAASILGFPLLSSFISSRFAFRLWLIAGGYMFILIFAFFFLVRGSKNFPPRKPVEKLSIAAALLLFIALVVTALTLPRYFHYYIEGYPPTAQKELRYAHGPFLQFPSRGEHSPDPKALAVWWFDPHPGSEPPAVEVSRRPAMDGVRIFQNPADTGKKRRSVTLNELSGGEKYYYRVPEFDSTVRSFTFPRRKKESVRITVLGDSSNAEFYRHSYFRELVLVTKKFYRNRGEKPDLILHLGDVADSGNDIPSWEHFLTGARPLISEFPAVISLGNHELKVDRGGNRDYLLAQPRYGAFDAGPMRVIFLHNFNSFSGINGLLDSAQYRFLEKELQKNAGRRWTMVVLHVSPVSTGDFNMNRGLMRQYLPLFRKYRVDLVMAGHDHHFEAFHMDRNASHGGTFLVINGCGGSRLDTYIMTRWKKRWRRWYHDRKSRAGLYQKDSFTANNHIRGELSWGFCEVEVENDVMKVIYYRWLSLPRFLKLTNQSPRRWEMRVFSEEFMTENNLWQVKPALVLEKNRKFPE